MDFIRERVEAEPFIAQAVKKFGYAPEHNIDWYYYATEKDAEPIFVVWQDGTALYTHKEENEWYIFSEPLAPIEKGPERVVEFLTHVFAHYPVKKVWLELREYARREVLHKLPSDLHANPINYTLVWPVIDMDQFDSTLPGGAWKSIRNARNKFYREHRVEVVDAVRLPKEALHTMVQTWVEVRKARDRAYPDCYHAIVDGGFAGMRSARAFVVDGEVHGLNAGWEMPGSPQDYYGAVGLHDYSSKDLGLVLFLEDLLWIKEAGYKHADMAGGEKQLTAYKNQFHPAYWYKTFVFSVVRK